MLSEVSNIMKSKYVVNQLKTCILRSRKSYLVTNVEIFCYCCFLLQDVVYLQRVQSAEDNLLLSIGGT